jgi:hypothetical protein
LEPLFDTLAVKFIGGKISPLKIRFSNGCLESGRKD